MARTRSVGFGKAAGTMYCLISDDAGPTDVYVTDLAGLGRSLPVFSFREEAELFLTLGGLEDGWRAAESGPGDFLALLFGPCADVRSVILDPLPAMLRDSTAGLVSLSLESFVDRFLSVPEPDGVAG